MNFGILHGNIINKAFQEGIKGPQLTSIFQIEYVVQLKQSIYSHGDVFILTGEGLLVNNDKSPKAK